MMERAPINIFDLTGAEKIWMCGFCWGLAVGVAGMAAFGIWWNW